MFAAYTEEFKEFQNEAGEKTLCKEWLITSLTLMSQGFGIMGTVAAINIGVEVAIGLFSEFFNKPRSYQQIQIEAMSGICVIQYIN